MSINLHMNPCQPLQPLKNTSFSIKLGSDKYLALEKMITSCAIPDISMSEAPTAFRNRSGFAPGEKIEYSALTCTFIVDENMENYKSLWNWIHANRDGEHPEYLDSSIIIYSSHNNPLVEYSFKSMFPVSLSELQFVTNTDTPTNLECTVSFRYDRAELK